MMFLSIHFDAALPGRTKLPTADAVPAAALAASITVSLAASMSDRRLGAAGEAPKSGLLNGLVDSA